MFAVTIQQPWAWAICRGGKTVENRHDRRGEQVAVRTWGRAAGHQVAIHTSKRDAGQEAFRVVRHLSPVEPTFPGGPGRATEWEYGAVVALARIGGVHGAAACYDPLSARFCSPWADDHAAHLVLEDVRVLNRPVPVNGQLGLWQITETTVLSQIRRQTA